MPTKARRRKNATERKSSQARSRCHTSSENKRDADEEQKNKTERPSAKRKDITELKYSQAERPEFDEIVLTHYLTPYLLHTEFEKRQTLTPKAQKIISIVIGQLETFLQKEGNQLFRNGKLSACGSVPEDTKVGKYDEFDYQYLITIGHYTATRKVHPRTRPRHGSASQKLGAKSFYELTMVRENRGDIELLAENTHDLFLENVCQAISQLDIEYTVKKAGPAVKLVFTHPYIEYCVKMDLTLGIEAEVLDVFKEGELTSLGVELLHSSEKTLKCHFVSSTDYWKICFLRSEQEIMRGFFRFGVVCNDKIKCYKIIKSLRDEVDVKDLYGDGILQSYPLKVTFMDLALADEKAGRKWTEQDTGRNVNRVLREVESRGQRHEICSLFVKDEEVMGESDRSYLESTRILNELARLHDTYLREKSVLPYTCMLLIGVISLIVHLLEYTNVQMNSPLNLRNLPLSNQICNVTANLHRYTNSSNLWEDILIGAHNFTFLLYMLETVCAVVYVFQWFNEWTKIKGHADIFPNSMCFVIIIASVHMHSAFLLLALSYRNEGEFEYYDRKLRHAMHECQLTTVFPVLNTLFAISMKAFISLLFPTNTLIFMESFFLQVKVSGEVKVDIAMYIRNVRGYLAEGPSRRPRHKMLYYLVILFTSVLLFLLEIFMYIYIWNEEDDQSFFSVRAHYYSAYFFIVPSFAQYCNFYVISLDFVIPLLLFLLSVEPFSYSQSDIITGFYLLIFQLFCLCLTTFRAHLIIDIMLICLHFFHMVTNGTIWISSCKFHWYQCVISAAIILRYHLMVWVYYGLALFADYVKSIHFSIAMGYMTYLIGLISVLFCIIVGLVLFDCLHSDAFRKYSARLLKVKSKKYADSVKYIAAAVLIIGFIGFYYFYYLH